MGGCLRCVIPCELMSPWCVCDNYLCDTIGHSGTGDSVVDVESLVSLIPHHTITLTIVARVKLAVAGDNYPATRGRSQGGTGGQDP